MEGRRKVITFIVRKNIARTVLGYDTVNDRYYQLDFKHNPLIC